MPPSNRYYSRGHVEVLENTADLHALFQKHPVAIVAVMANGCGHCVNIKPTFVNKAKFNAGRVASGVIVTDTKNGAGHELAEHLFRLNRREFSGTPHFILFVQGQWAAEVGGADESGLQNLYMKALKSNKSPSRAITRQHFGSPSRRRVSPNRRRVSPNRRRVSPSRRPRIPSGRRKNTLA